MDLGRYSSSLGKYMTFKHYMLAHSWRCMGHRLEHHNIIVLTFDQFTVRGLVEGSPVSMIR